MATSFDFGGLLGGAFGGGLSALDDLLTPEQRAAIQQQAGLSAAAALLQAAGPSTTRTSLGQALGSAFTAGQAGMQKGTESALAQMLTRQKLDEAKREREATEGFRQTLKSLMPGASAGQPMTPEQALAVPGMRVGPTPERAALIGQVPPAAEGAAAAGPQLTQAQLSLIATMPRKEGAAELLKMLQPPKLSDKAQLLQDLGMKPTLANLRLLDKPEAAPEKIRILQSMNLPITLENLQSLDALPSEVKILQSTKTPVTLENVMNLRRSGASNITVTEGQKGFENEMSLGKAFRNEPIYKDYSDMKTAYSQVLTSLTQGTPIGDVAGATKIMKLLDPGSVVRESELGIAMAAAGRMDRLSNYFSMWKSGEKLTPTQREDFKALANELYAAAAQSYNNKRKEYEGFGSSYGFKNLETALGPQATAPSLMREAAAGATGPRANRRPLSDIFGGGN
jgi:hypothetical protein